MDLNALRDRFAIPGSVDLITANGGLPAVRITTPVATAEVYLHGAHVTKFVPVGETPVLFVSGRSLFADGKAIRGGVPVIFPWFGPHPTDPKIAAHGLVRARAWQLATADKKPDGSVAVRLTFSSDIRTRAVWPHEFELTYTVTVGRTLGLELAVQNTGDAPFQFEEALHTYLTLADVRQAKVDGLAGRTYIDKTDKAARKVQTESPFGITGETDRVYLDTPDTVTVADPAGSTADGRPRVLAVTKQNSAVTVVWNPWVAKAAALSDFGDDEWPGMICVETANAADSAVTLAAGQTHRMTAGIGLA
jgi:glucose-6-phosphate 1-epimerase